MASQVPKPNKISKLAAEFLGTFMLVFVVGLNITQTDPATGFSAIAIGCTLMVLVYAFAPISGAHLNPAVTLSMVLQDATPLMEGLEYMAAQFAGGALAGLASGFMVGFEVHGAEIGPKSVDVRLATGGSSHIEYQGFMLGAPLCEFFYTFLLCFVVLNVAVQVEGKAPNNFYGMAIGFVIIAAKGAAAVSGGALNPAVALGVNFLNGPSLNFFFLPIYIVVQFIAAFLATTLFHIVRPKSRKGEFKLPDQAKAAAPYLGAFTKASNTIESKFDPEDTAEFVGTFYICLTISLNAMLADNPGAIWSVGACFMVLIFALGDVSGAVFNPALTIAFSIRWLGTGKGFGDGKMCDPQKSKKEVLKYTIAQLLGAAAGVGGTILIYIFSGAWPTPNVGPVVDLNGHLHTEGQAFFAETFGTFMLCYVVLASVSIEKPLQEYVGFAVGATIIAAGYSFGAISGGLLNPAVTLANSIGHQFELLTNLNPGLYMVAQVLGGVLSAIVFKHVTHPHEYTDKTVDARELAEPLVGAA